MSVELVLEIIQTVLLAGVFVTTRSGARNTDTLEGEIAQIRRITVNRWIRRANEEIHRLRQKEAVKEEVDPE